MPDGNARHVAPKRAIVLAALSALGATWISGCAGQESPAPPTSLPATTSAKTVDASTAREASAGAPSTATASSDASGQSSVTVEAASPDDLKKFIASQKGKVVFVDFWATYCLPCREKYPRTLALAKKYSDQGLIAASMSMDSPEPSYQKRIQEFLTQQNSQIKNFANRLEDTDAAFAALDIAGGALPHYKIYGRNGKLRKQFGGDPDHPFDDADIERALVAALKEP
jgi:thiol-disulfide isomerase/thioredoxin